MMMESNYLKHKHKNKKKERSLESIIQDRIDKVKSTEKKKEEESIIVKNVNLKLFKEIIDKSIPVFKKETKYKIPTVKPTLPKSLCLIMSDVHIGAKHEGYDLMVFEKKLKKLFDEVSTEITEKKIDELVVFLIGDVVDGEQIYPGHSNYICLPVAEQSVIGAKYIADFLMNLSIFCKVRVECIAGNHGRPGKKGDSTLRTNWDTILYYIVATHVKDWTNIRVNVHTDWKAFVKVQELTVMAFHGDDVAKGNPLISLPNAIVQWADLFRNQVSFDVAVTGHYHLPMLSLDVNGRELFINGGFPPATSVYVEKGLKKASKCGQVMFIIEGTRIYDRNLVVL